MTASRSGALAALVLALAVPSPAAPPDASVSLTLAEAVARAREASPRLEALRSLQAGSVAALEGARAERWPVLSLSATYNRFSEIPELSLTFPDGNSRVVFPNIPDAFRTRAELQQPLYTGGRVGAGIRSAEQNSLAASSDTATGAADLLEETTDAYWALVRARELERVQREAIASYEAHLQDVRNLIEAGMAARNDLLSVQVARDRAELDRLEARNAAETANEDLLRLLAFPPATRIEPTEPLDPAQAPPEDVESLVAAAAERRSELKSLRARAEAAAAEVSVARASKRLQATLNGGFEYSNPNPRILPLEAKWQDSWTVGVAVSLTPFDGGRASAASAVAQARADALNSQIRDLERRIRLEVTARALEVETARAALVVVARNVEAALENVQVSRDRYREGLVRSSELLDAETDVLRANLDRTVALTRMRTATARLDRAVER
jgi:outer membrane protein TolC